jgi:pyruvate dehydrogenase E2 component (dihydrolipoamide acetyltransferase)
LAHEEGLALEQIQGSGPEGAVLAGDVLQSAEAAKRSEEAAPPEPAAQSLDARATIPTSRMWQVMAERLTQSWMTVPQFSLARDVDAGRLVAWRAELQARTAHKITYTDLLIKLVSGSLAAHPRLNASWQNATIVRNDAINIGVAVTMDEGLLVPVIHNADQLGVNAIAQRRAALVQRCQTLTMAPDDLAGGTFTISNLGMFGVDRFRAIVNPPQAAILAVGRIAERVVAVDGQPVVRPMLALDLTCDHRVVDGSRAAQFLEHLAELIEEPLRLLE